MPATPSLYPWLTNYHSNGKRDNVIVKTAPEAWQLQNESGVLKAYQDKTPHLRRLIDEVEGTEGPQALVLEHLDDDMLNFCTAEKLSSKELKQVARSALEALKILHEGGDVHTGMIPFFPCVCHRSY